MTQNLKITLGLLMVLLGLSVLYSCSIGGGTVTPPSAYISLNTFYKTAKDVDLLNQENPLAYKNKDLSIISKMEVDGIIKEISYNENSVPLYWDSSTKFYYFETFVPTQYKTRKPIETYVKLSPSVKDTITYTFNLEGTEEERAYPDKIFYNKKLVWEKSKQPVEGRWLPITIVR